MRWSVASNSAVTAPESTASGHPFDAAASGYDEAFTDTPLGRWYRKQVWQRLAESFQPGDHVLDLGCGTGEDAIWLAQRGVHVIATDASPTMLDVARQKAVASNADELITFHRMDLITVGSAPLPEPVPSVSEGSREGSRLRADGAYSNFGPLNCLEDRRPLAGALFESIRPGGRLILVVMGPLCPWEMLWHTLRLEFRTAFRRLRSGALAHVGEGEKVRVWYPSIGTLEREFSPYFSVIERFGLGLLVPPSGMDRLVRRAPRLFSKLAVIDKHAGHLKPWLWLNDHYMVVMERRSR
jgi:SAM-dependent methyltransferase